MKYLSSAFSPMMISNGQFTGTPISLAQAEALAADAKSVVGHEVTAPILTALLRTQVAFNRENVALVPGDKVICVIPKFRADKAREFSHEEVVAAGFSAFWVEITPAPVPIEEDVKKPVEWRWNDGMGSRSRYPRCMVIAPDGNVHWFAGSSIPGVVKVLGSDYEKNGKWSNSTYRCVSPAGTIIISWMQDFGTGRTFTQDTWEESFAWLQKQAPHANFTSFEAVVRANVPKHAARCDENDAAMREMGA